MIHASDIVAFVPACGLGERVAPRGRKPFMEVNQNRALDLVLSQIPHGVSVEIALPSGFGCVPLEQDVVVHFIKRQTRGQADTIYQWLRQTRLREWVLISNCDNCIDMGTISDAIHALHNGAHGYVFTFQPKDSGDKRFSYVQMNIDKTITDIREKVPISDDACAGVYLLRMFELRMALRDTDVYLSEALARMVGLKGWRAERYMGWNDMDQLKELENGLEQTR